MALNNFLRTRGTEIIDSRGQRIFLRGINLGGWLMMEAYFLYTPNLPVHRFKEQFKKSQGAAALADFEKSYSDHFITEKDIEQIRKWGFNCIRLPFHHNLVSKYPNKINSEGVKLIDRAVRWAKKNKIYLILDLHAAPGSQNHDWHSDSSGKANLWSNKKHQNHTLFIWEYLADRYKNEPWIAGYDLLNEAVLDDTRKLNTFYEELIHRIRTVDENHILFIEGNKWAQDIECLNCFDDSNYVLSIHNYEPIDYTFNFIPHLKYPLKTKSQRWNKTTTLKHLKKYDQLSKKRNVPIFVGEFGINTREGLYGEDIWLSDTLSVFEQFNFHWTYWTYKAVKNYTFPDGVLSYKGNPSWVRREGPVMGWDTYKDLWQGHRRKMKQSWKSSEFTVNKEILRELKNYVH